MNGESIRIKGILQITRFKVPFDVFLGTEAQQGRVTCLESPTCSWLTRGISTHALLSFLKSYKSNGFVREKEDLAEGGE
jgi:hypothetical protein